MYHNQRVAGDFYEFLRVGPSRVLFGLFDLAGRREDTREILIAAQNTFRILRPGTFCGQGLQRGRGDGSALPRSQPHHPAGCRRHSQLSRVYRLLQRGSGHGLLHQRRAHAGAASRRFRNHATGGQRPAARHLLPRHPERLDLCAEARSAALLLVSRGIVEAEHDDQEFGLEGAKKSFQGASALTAQNLCLAILAVCRAIPGGCLRLTTTSPRWCCSATVAPTSMRRRSSGRKSSPTAHRQEENKTPSRIPAGW